MENEELTEYLESMNERIYEQLSYAETKHAVLVGFVGAAIFSIIGIIIDLHESNLLWLQIWLGVISAKLLASLILSLISFYPNRNTLNKKKNLYFYGDLANYKDAHSYLNDVQDTSQLNEQLAEQNIMISSIIVKKHQKFTWALHLCLASILTIHYIGIVIILIKKKKKGHNSKSKLQENENS